MGLTFTVRYVVRKCRRPCRTTPRPFPRTPAPGPRRRPGRSCPRTRPRRRSLEAACLPRASPVRSSTLGQTKAKERSSSPLKCLYRPERTPSRSGSRTTSCDPPHRPSRPSLRIVGAPWPTPPSFWAPNPRQPKTNKPFSEERNRNSFCCRDWGRIGSLAGPRRNALDLVWAYQTFHIFSCSQRLGLSRLLSSITATRNAPFCSTQRHRQASKILTTGNEKKERLSRNTVKQIFTLHSLHSLADRSKIDLIDLKDRLFVLLHIPNIWWSFQ